VKLTNHIHQVPRFRMNGPVPSRPHNASMFCTGRNLSLPLEDVEWECKMICKRNYITFLVSIFLKIKFPLHNIEVWTYDKVKSDLGYNDRIFLFLLLTLLLNISCRKYWVHSEWVTFFPPKLRAIIFKQRCMHCNYGVVEEWNFIKVIFDSNRLFYCLYRKK